jgi:hypothetical protein
MGTSVRSSPGVPAVGGRNLTMTITRELMTVADEAEATFHRPPHDSRHVIGDARLVMRVDVLIYGEPCWASNELRFLDEAEARTFARGLRSRWIVIEKTRVVPETWPSNDVCRGARARAEARVRQPMRALPGNPPAAAGVDPGISGPASTGQGVGGSGRGRWPDR